MAKVPRIALYVSSVKGRLASRPGSPYSYIGARLTSKEERADGAEPIVWSPDQVVPIPEPEYLAYQRDYDGAIRRGDLAKRSPADFVTYQEALAKSEAEHTKRLDTDAKKAEAEAKKAEAERKKVQEDEARASKLAEQSLGGTGGSQ